VVLAHPPADDLGVLAHVDDLRGLITTVVAEDKIRASAGRQAPSPGRLSRRRACGARPQGTPVRHPLTEASSSSGATLSYGGGAHPDLSWPRPPRAAWDPNSTPGSSRLARPLAAHPGLSARRDSTRSRR
jgi:hypothetical protein